MSTQAGAQLPLLMPQAWQARQQALAILEDIQHPDADLVRAKLDSTDGPS